MEASDAGGTRQANEIPVMIPHAVGRHIPRQPQIVAFAVVLILTSVVSWWLFRSRLALLTGFDAAALVYLVLVIRALSSAAPGALRSRGARYDTGRRTLLMLAALVFGVVLVAVAAELGHGSRRTPAELALIVATLFVAWCFGNMIFAQEYMHRHYGTKKANGLNFPGDGEPGFWEFVYFAYTIGMTFQTSDVSIGTTDLRRLTTLHALCAFFFNVGVVALSVNLLAGQ